MRALLATLLIFGTSFAFARDHCDDLLARGRWRVPDLWVGLGARSGPSHEEKRFELNLDVSNLRSPLSAARVKAHSVRAIEEGLASLAALGFKPRSYLNVVVSLDDSSLPEQRFNEYPRWTRRAGGPAYVNPGTHVRLGVTGAGGETRALWPNARQPSLDGQYVVFARWPDHPAHPIENAFIVAHELAHTTESTPMDELWQEARADLLAYLMTGIQHVDFGFENVIAIGLDGGLVQFARSTRIRSLARPDIFALDELLPGFQFYHENSTILSNLLYRLMPIIGRGRLVGYVKRLDRARCTDPDRPGSLARADVQRDFIVRALTCYAERLRAELKRDGLYDAAVAGMFDERGF